MQSHAHLHYSKKQPTSSVSQLRGTATSGQPPMVLVNTWFWMMQKAQEQSIRSEGQRRLVIAFGSISSAVKYVEENGGLRDG